MSSISSDEEGYHHDHLATTSGANPYGADDDVAPATGGDAIPPSSTMREYRDFFHMDVCSVMKEIKTPKGKRKGPRGGVVVPFPVRLYTMLEAVEKEGLDYIVAWQPHGRCFIVRQPKKFVEQVLPTYFGQSKIASFQRQLNLYGFQRLRKGRDRGGFYHELFLRYRPELSKLIFRTLFRGTSNGASSPAGGQATSKSHHPPSSPKSISSVASVNDPPLSGSGKQVFVHAPEPNLYKYTPCTEDPNLVSSTNARSMVQLESCMGGPCPPMTVSSGGVCDASTGLGGHSAAMGAAAYHMIESGADNGLGGRPDFSTGSFDAGLYMVDSGGASGDFPPMGGMEQPVSPPSLMQATFGSIAPPGPPLLPPDTQTTPELTPASSNNNNSSKGRGRKAYASASSTSSNGGAKASNARNAGSSKKDSIVSQDAYANGERIKNQLQMPDLNVNNNNGYVSLHRFVTNACNNGVGGAGGTAGIGHGIGPFDDDFCFFAGQQFHAVEDEVLISYETKNFNGEGKPNQPNTGGQLSTTQHQSKGRRVSNCYAAPVTSGGCEVTNTVFL